MSMTVTRHKDTNVFRVLMHKIADIRGGVSVHTAELGGDYLREGSVLSVPINGISYVVKTAMVVAPVEAQDKTIKVKKGHNFKENDCVFTEIGGAAAKITKIDATTSREHDTLTIDKALGAIAVGGGVVEAKSAAASGAEFKYSPLALSGTGKSFDKKSNVDVDAWVIGVTKNNPLPACVAKCLTGIINY